MGTHLRVLIRSYPMNTNMTLFTCFPKDFAFWCYAAYVLWPWVCQERGSEAGGTTEGQDGGMHFLLCFQGWLPVLLCCNTFNLYAGGGYLANTKWCRNPENGWNPGIWVLIWEYSTRAFQWIPTWQGLDGFQKYLGPCALDECSLSIGRVKHII